MDVAIRVAQVVLGLFALNTIYGLALFAGLSAFYDETAGSSILNAAGSLISVALYCFIIYLLQRYYELRNTPQAKALSNQKFIGIALTSASIAAMVGFALAVLIVVAAFIRL